MKNMSSIITHRESIDNFGNYYRMDQRDLACPARFERATYALEAHNFDDFNSIFNSLDLAKSGVV